MRLVPRPDKLDRLERALERGPGFTLLVAFMLLTFLFERGHWIFGSVLFGLWVVSIALEFSPEMEKAYMALRSSLRLKPLP